MAVRRLVPAADAPLAPERLAVERIAACAASEAQTLPEGDIRSLLEELGFTLRRLAVVREVGRSR